MINIEKNGTPRVSRLTPGRKLQILLNKNERSVSWLAKKIGVSHTLVHNWIKDKSDIVINN